MNVPNNSPFLLGDIVLISFLSPVVFLGLV